LPGAHIDPGAFALVGMGTFYGGIAHVPLSALVFVSGSYDLLVPLMLAEGIAFVALRNKSLYEAQVATKRESPTHDAQTGWLARTHVGDIMTRRQDFVRFRPPTPLVEVVRGLAHSAWQETERVRGVIGGDVLRLLTAEQELTAWAIAADVMESPIVVLASDEARMAGPWNDTASGLPRIRPGEAGPGNVLPL
jgi:CIC family chloride channel protein